MAALDRYVSPSLSTWGGYVPYFVRIGPILTNGIGVGSRGYHVYRRGQKVFHRWGQVEVRRGPKFYWVWKREGEFRGKTVNAAAKWLASEVARRQNREKYQRLPAGQKILEAKPVGR